MTEFYSLLCWSNRPLCMYGLCVCVCVCVCILVCFLFLKRKIPKNIATIYVKECFACVFFQDFSRFTLSSLIYFEFMVVYSVRKYSNLFFLHVADFFLHHLLKRLSFPIVYYCLLCHRLIGQKS